MDNLFLYLLFLVIRSIILAAAIVLLIISFKEQGTFYHALGACAMATVWLDARWEL